MIILAVHTKISSIAAGDNCPSIFRTWQKYSYSKNSHSPYFIDPKKGLLTCSEESAIRTCYEPAGLVHRLVAFFFNMHFDIVVNFVFLK
jgi:hypothetical protein